jgi:hypothetical protein
MIEGTGCGLFAMVSNPVLFVTLSRIIKENGEMVTYIFLGR